MPGSPATTPKMALPRYAGADPAQFAPQVNAISDRVDQLYPAFAYAPTYDLPPIEFEGSEAYVLHNGEIWNLRWRTTSTAPYKWEFVGGPPMYDFVDTSQSRASATLGDLATVGPGFLAPLAGVYRYQFVVEAIPSATSYMEVALMNPGGGASPGNVVRSFNEGGRSSMLTGIGEVTLAAGDTVKLGYGSGGLGVAFKNRRLFVTPVRVDA